ncbi:hypothetical protein FQA39_LY05320 [Lamprigera yunnana]|nr:hypothetical protein FQA39_LY05320 [Lamprigera yunnana]
MVTVLSLLCWSKWTDWSSCSVTCSAGIQQRIRHCLLADCPGFNIEQRHCNLFGCPDTVNPLALDEGKFFHPSRDRWQKVPDRPTAWRLKPNSYIWLPSSQLFPDLSARTFPKEFTLFITLRLQNDSNMGTIFSLRSRRRQDTYLSLEIAGFDLKLVHATSNGTDVVRIPTTLDDKKWHQIAIGIRDDSVVETYIDCQWSRTDILKKDAIDIPKDSDLIVGYLFSGDLEQMSIVSDPTLVSLQCSNLRTPIIDPTVKDIVKEENVNKPIKNHKKQDFHHKNENQLVCCDNNSTSMNVRNVTDSDANTAYNTQNHKNQDLIITLKKQINLLKTNSPGRRDEKIRTQKRLTKSNQTTSSKQKQLYSEIVLPQQSRPITHNFEHTDAPEMHQNNSSATNNQSNKQVKIMSKTAHESYNSYPPVTIANTDINVNTSNALSDNKNEFIPVTYKKKQRKNKNFKNKYQRL